MAEEIRLRVTNVSEVETTELPHEGYERGERLKLPTVEQMGWDTVELGTSIMDPGCAYTSGISTVGERGDVDWDAKLACDEVAYIVSGGMTVYWGDNEKTILKAGDFAFFPKGLKLYKAVNEGSEPMVCVYGLYSPDLRRYMKEHLV